MSRARLTSNRKAELAIERMLRSYLGVLGLKVSKKVIHADRGVVVKLVKEADGMQHLFIPHALIEDLTRKYLKL